MIIQLRRSVITCVNVLIVALMLLQTILPAVPVHAAAYETTIRAPIESDLEQEEPQENLLVEEQSSGEELSSEAEDVYIVPPIETEPVEPEPTLSSAPVNLEIQTDYLFLRSGQQAHITVTAMGTNELNTEGLELTLTLPPLLIPEEEGAPLTWVLPDLPLKQKFTQTVKVRAAENAFGVFDIRADIADSEKYFGHWDAIKIGVSSENQKNQGQEIAAASVKSNHLTANGLVLEDNTGNVTVLVSPNAAEIGTEFAYTEIFHASASKTQALSSQTESDSNQDSSEQLFLPLMISGQTTTPQARSAATVTPKLVDGVYAYQMWQLDATKDGVDVADFSDDVKLYVDASWLAEQGVETHALKLWTRETSKDEWQLLDFHYDAETHLFAADLPHFSEFTLGGGLTSSGHRLPSIEGFTSDRHTGAASVHYPIDAPTGLGGLSPNMSLSYSSMESDNNYAQEGKQYKTQASEIGYGWNLGGISYIAEIGKDKHSESVYSMVLNGTSVTIRKEEGKWRTSPRLFAKIERLGSSSSGSGTSQVRNYYYWRVTTTDGTKYEFGNFSDTGGQNGFDSNYGSEYSHTDPTITSFGSYGGQYYRYARQWHIRRVVDTLGNKMFYDYQGEKNYIISCVPSSFITANRNWYTRALYPSQIRWSKPDSDYQLRMRFLYSGTIRDDYKVFEHEDFNCNQARFGKKNQLTSIRSEALVGSSWKMIRRYDLKQSHDPFDDHESTEQKRLILNEIKSFGSNHSYLNSHSFAYSSWDVNRIYLRSTDNGQGGKVNYVYKQHKVECDRGCPVIHHLSQPVRNRYPVGWIITEDGQGNATVVKNYYGHTNHSDAKQRWGRIADSGRFLGFKEAQTTFYDKVAASSITLPTNAINGTFNPPSSAVLKFERQQFYQLRPEISNYDKNQHCDRLCNPDPRHGKTKLHEIYAGGSVNSNNIYAQTVTDWQTVRRKNGAWEVTDKMFDIYNNANNSDNDHFTFWQRQNKVTTWADGAMNAQLFAYEEDMQSGSQYGNLTQTNEYAAVPADMAAPSSPNAALGTNLLLQRITYTQYYPNPTKHIVNRPARVVVADGNNNCVAESRTIYDVDSDVHGGVGIGTISYTTAPENGLPQLTKTRLTGNCAVPDPNVNPDQDPEPDTIATQGTAGLYNGAWSVSYIDYDGYGNPTHQIQYGPSTNGSQNLEIETAYDGTYKLFPIKQWNSNKPSLEETGQYYGVNRSYSSSGAFWGAMAEHCGVNDICTRQKYDQFGRPEYRWTNGKKGEAWGTNGEANTKWVYIQAGQDWNGVDVSSNVVVESNAPSNFVRKHYNGLGQLMYEQRPHQDWVLGDCPNCNEVDVSFAYDGLGRQKQASVPHSKTGDWRTRSTDFSQGKTTNQFDVLGRTTRVTSPNSEVSTFEYKGRQSWVTQSGKVLKWEEVDGLGNLKEIRSFATTGDVGNNRPKAIVKLTHDVVGNLLTTKRQVRESSGQLGSLRNLSTMSYDKGERKLSMTDADLGTWGYVYDRLGKLTRQTDACGNQTNLGYDATVGWLLTKRFVEGSNSNCNTVKVAYGINYTYGTSGTQNGQITQVAYTDRSYKKNWAYNAKGLVSSEKVTITGGEAAGYTTSFTYDAYNRLQTTKYPDNEVITHAYNGMGLPAKLTSSISGDLVDGDIDTVAVNDAVEYDEAGRLINMRFPAGGNLWHKKRYYSWTGGNGKGNGRLSAIQIGSSKTRTDKLNLSYSGYDVFGNITQLGESYNGASLVNNSFTYNSQNRLTQGYGKNYTYDPEGRLTSYEGTTQTANTSFPLNGLKNSSHNSYDANGNMKKRPGQTLYWDVENRLHQVRRNAADVETYLYDENGIRVRKQNNDSTTLYIGNHFEVEINHTGSTIQAVNLALHNATDQAEDTPSAFNDESAIALDEWQEEIEPPAEEIETGQPDQILDQKTYLAFVSDSTGVEFDSQEPLPFIDVGEEQILNTDGTTDSFEPFNEDGDNGQDVDDPDTPEWIDEPFDLTASNAAVASEETVQAVAIDAVVSNPGFESSGVWAEKRSWPGTAFHRSKWGVGQERTGTYGHSISNLAYGSLQSEYISVLPNTKYNVYAHTRGEVDTDDSQGGWSLRVYFYNNNSSRLIGNKNLRQEYSAQSGWRRVGGSVTVPSNATRMKVILLVHMVSGWVAWDDIEVKKSGTSTNLLANPGFESSGAWTEARSNAFPGTSFYRSGWGTAAERSGSKAYVISNHAYGVLRSPYITASQNTQYDLYTYVRGEIDTDDSQGNWLVRVHYYRSDNSKIKHENATVGPAISTSWQRKGKRITTPAGTAKVRIELFNYMNTGWVAFDDVELKKVGNSTNLVPNPGFESSGSWQIIRTFPGTAFYRSGWGTASERSGSKAYVISNHAYGRLDSAMISIAGGKKYSVNAYLRGEIDPEDSNNGWIIRARFYTSSGAYISQANAEYAYNGDGISQQWHHKGGILTAPSNAAKMQVWIYKLMSNGWIGIDDVSVGDVAYTKYYRFGGQLVAKRTDGTLTYLHTDHLGSSVLETNTSGAKTTAQRYYAYGKKRGTETVATDNQYTGQKQDGTGLMYYNARYYDPTIGQFISPDTIVPDPSSVSDYNRYMYVRGNPINASDPSGHCASTISDAENVEYDNEECLQWAQNYYNILTDHPEYFEARWGGEYGLQNPGEWLALFGADPFWGTDYMKQFFHQGQSATHVRKYNVAMTETEFEPVPEHPINGFSRAGRTVIGGAVRDYRECQDSLANCGRMLDDVSVGLSSVAVTCTGLVLPPCAVAASVGSGITGVAGIGLTINDALQEDGDSTGLDVAVSVGTTAVGVASPPPVGFFASLAQWLWGR